MKKIKVMFTAIVLFFTVPAFASVLVTDSSARLASETVTEQITKRIDVLQSIDKLQLNRTEKRNLRKERKAISKELRAASGGVYISVGVLLIVIILLIVLL